ncbi:serine/threonine protein kinase [Candidatus Moduliflexus flocculans]|uniref:Serine/threonine protein kinase n=1 Tax=Candidatus Moduliflexus flocculans TaxID=1499966 RepID=A0A0S6VY51_9BACT|nr:serine/threonine protein kinase [Candidatus Moduliflexus flocculans]
MGTALKYLLIALGAQLPVIGVAVVWWAEILKHPLSTAVLAVMYEGILLGWAILGKDVWETLRPDMVKATADWVKVSLLNAFSDFRRRYNTHVLYEHRVFGSKGLRTPGQGILELAQVFVELRVAPSHALQVSASPLTAKTVSGSQPVWAFLQRLKKNEATAFAILGPPGCGKTTLLKHVALTFAANQQRQYRLRAYTPMLLLLREQAALIVEQSPSLAELAHTHFANQKRYPELDPPPQWVPRAS